MSFLQTVTAEARARVEAARAVAPEEALRARAGARPAAPGFAAALREPGVAVIAEIKRRSPSRGDLAPIADVAEQARRYISGGAAALSVLTEPAHFGGSLDDLSAVADAVPAPALRKDFLVDPYQVWEAAAAGAGAVLAIVAALPDDALVALLRAAADARLDVLVEVHDPEEAKRAVVAHERAGVPLPLVIGVNARDLTTLVVDPGRFEATREALPEDAVTVAESGVAGPGDVTRLGGLGADAVLVGEHLVTAADPAAAVAALVAAGAVRAPQR